MKANRSLINSGFIIEISLFFFGGYLLSLEYVWWGLVCVSLGILLAIRVGDEIQRLGVERFKKGEKI